MVFIAAPLRWLEKNDKPPETGGDVRWAVRRTPADVKRHIRAATGENPTFSDKYRKRYLDTA
jgi:hypothetical protein